MLLVLAQANPPEPVDDFAPGLAIFALAMFGFLVVVVLLFVGAVGAAIGGTLAAATALILGVIAGAVALTCVAHLILAIIVWTRRPRRRVWFSIRWWGWLTLFTGLLAALPFWWLHYTRRGRPSCYRCGYDLSGRAMATAPAGTCLLCPECGEPRR
jgi:hypothetical protein